MIYRRLYGVPSFGYRDRLNELDRMRRQMGRLLGDFSSLTSDEPKAGVFPLVNITEDKDNFYIRAELPGVEAGGLDIQATANNISISGERKIAPEAEGAKYPITVFNPVNGSATAMFSKVTLPVLVTMMV